MATVIRMRVAWSGGALVGPGVSTFYFADAHTGFVADVAAFFASLAGRFPSSTSWNIPDTGDLINDATGDLVGVWNDGTGSTLAGTATNVFARGVGARIVWNTAGSTNNRRVRGATFMAPLDSTALQNDGTLNDTVRTEINTAATALVSASSGQMVVLTRVRPGVAGKSSPVTSATVPDKISWLRSRRV